MRFKCFLGGQIHIYIFVLIEYYSTKSLNNHVDHLNIIICILFRNARYQIINYLNTDVASATVYKPLTSHTFPAVIKYLYSH